MKEAKSISKIDVNPNIYMGQIMAIRPEALVGVINSFFARENNIDINAFGGLFDFDTEKPNYIIKDNIAEIKIKGVMSGNIDIFSLLFGGGCCTTQIESSFIDAQKNDDVKGILLHVDSPGGNTQGTENLSNTIYSYRGKKPVITFIEGECCSAAYWVASNSDYLIASGDTNIIGSIGVLRTNFDLTRQAENEGVKIDFTTSGKYKATGNRFKALTGEDKEYLQSIIDSMFNIFVKSISKARDMAESDILESAGDGQVFLSKKALDIGFIDEILSKRDTIKRLKEIM